MVVLSVLYRTAAFGRGSFRQERSTAVSRPGHLRNRNAVVAPAATVDSVSVQDKGIDARSWYSRFDELLSQQGPPCKVGDRITGTVISVDGKGAFVDVGGKAAAYASLDDLSMAKLHHASEAVWPGAVREFAVMGERSNGSFYLSLKALEENLTWMRLRQLQEDNVSVQVVVKSSNRGGLLVEYTNVLGFIPMSHLNRGNSTQPEELIGKQLNAKLLEVDQERLRLVLSNRQASFNAMRKFTVGDVVEGVVSKIAPYGAFLDIDDGVLGLLHVSQISHDRVVNVDRVVSVGDKLKVLILSQDRTNGRVSLSTKKLEPRPGDMLRSPQLVYEHASEMAALFRDRVAAAERTAREEEARLNAEME